MKKVLSLVSLLALFASTTVFANSLYPQGRAPTVEIELAEGDFDAETAMAAFAEGRHGNEAELTGSWMLVGSAKVIPEDLGGALYPYTPEGVKNSDGTYFNEFEISIVTDFYGNRVFSAKVMNLGADSNDQGPFPVVLGDSESMGGSGKHRGIPQNIYGPGQAQLENQCRLVKGFSDRMICTGIYRDRNSRDTNLGKYDGQRIVVRGFMKRAL